MTKIFLVEDEFVVREGIKKNIDWNAHGYEFCGEASDGELAFPLIKKEKPDIVITDIRMPFMDGLQLSKLIKAEMPWIEIIILTGFEEFEYAKEGIKLGVARYLTKPISGDDLLSEIDTLAQKIEENRREREIKEKYTRETIEETLNEKKNLFESIVRGNKTTAELYQKAEALEISLSAAKYEIILVNIQASSHLSSEYSNRIVNIDNDLEIILDNQIIVFDRDLEGKAFLIMADSDEEINEKTEQFISKAIKIFEKYEEISYFGGIGSIVDRLSEISESFKTASHAFMQRYFINDNIFIRSEQISSQLVQETDTFNITDIDPNKFDRSKIKEFLKFGEKDEVQYFVEGFFLGLGTNAIESQVFRQYITMDIYFNVVEFLKSLELSKEEIDNFKIEPNIVKSSDETIKYVVEIVDKAIDIRIKNSSGQYNDIVEEVKLYIEKNYAEEELSLNLVASEINISPNHLSMVFSQKTGSTFIKYLTNYRLEKAKELLVCTNKKSSEISILVGYKDPHYFSYLFKKTIGCTPTQFRESKES